MLRYITFQGKDWLLYQAQISIDQLNDRSHEFFIRR